MIKLVTFDLDDTLWDTAPAIAGAEVTLRDWLGEHAPVLGAVPVEHLWEIRSRLVAEDPSFKHRISALRRRVLFHALEDAGYDPDEAQDTADRGFEVFLQGRHQVQIFPEVQPMLEILAKTFTLGVITNGNADVRRLGLADYFAFALCAEDWASASLIRHRSWRRCAAQRSMPARRCMSVTIPRTISQVPSRPACAPSGTTRKARHGMRIDCPMPRSTTCRNCPRCWRAGPEGALTGAHRKARSDGGLFSYSHAASDRAATVFVVRLLGRIGDHVGLHFLHLAATRGEFFHGTCQSITLLVLGFHAGQFIDRDCSLGLAFCGRCRNVIVYFDRVVAGSSCKLLTVLFVFRVVFQIVLNIVVVAHVVPHDLRKLISYSPTAQNC